MNWMSEGIRQRLAEMAKERRALMDSIFIESESIQNARKIVDDMERQEATVGLYMVQTDYERMTWFVRAETSRAAFDFWKDTNRRRDGTAGDGSRSVSVCPVPSATGPAGIIDDEEFESFDL